MEGLPFQRKFSSSSEGRAMHFIASGRDFEEIWINLDHIKEKALPGNWKFALDADNLEMTSQNPNAYRQIVQMRHPELRPGAGFD